MFALSLLNHSGWGSIAEVLRISLQNLSEEALEAVKRLWKENVARIHFSVSDGPPSCQLTEEGVLEWKVRTVFVPQNAGKTQSCDDIEWTFVSPDRLDDAVWRPLTLSQKTAEVIEKAVTRIDLSPVTALGRFGKVKSVTVALSTNVAVELGLEKATRLIEMAFRSAEGRAGSWMDTFLSVDVRTVQLLNKPFVVPPLSLLSQVVAVHFQFDQSDAVVQPSATLTADKEETAVKNVFKPLTLAIRLGVQAWKYGEPDRTTGTYRKDALSQQRSAPEVTIAISDVDNAIKDACNRFFLSSQLASVTKLHLHTIDIDLANVLNIQLQEQASSAVLGATAFLRDLQKRLIPSFKKSALALFNDRQRIVVNRVRPRAAIPLLPIVVDSVVCSHAPEWSIVVEISDNCREMLRERVRTLLHESYDEQQPQQQEQQSAEVCIRAVIASCRESDAVDAANEVRLKLLITAPFDKIITRRSPLEADRCNFVDTMEEAQSGTAGESEEVQGSARQYDISSLFQDFTEGTVSWIWDKVLQSLKSLLETSQAKLDDSAFAFPSRLVAPSARGAVLRAQRQARYRAIISPEGDGGLSLSRQRAGRPVRWTEERMHFHAWGYEVERRRRLAALRARAEDLVAATLIGHRRLTRRRFRRRERPVSRVQPFQALESVRAEQQDLQRLHGALAAAENARPRTQVSAELSTSEMNRDVVSIPSFAILPSLFSSAMQRKQVGQLDDFWVRDCPVFLFKNFASSFFLSPSVSD